MTIYDIARYIEVRLSTIPEMATVQYFRADRVNPTNPIGNPSALAIGSWAVTNYSNVAIGDPQQYVDGFFEILLSFDRKRLEHFYDLADVIASNFPRQVVSDIYFKRTEIHTPYINDAGSRYSFLSPDRLNLPITIYFQFIKD